LLCRISHLWIFRWKSKRIRTYLMINFNQYYQIYNMNGYKIFNSMGGNSRAHIRQYCLTCPLKIFKYNFFLNQFP
jgi:hypothetical protein